MYPSQFVQSVIQLKGEPFSLEERDYLLPIYDGGYKFMVLRTGRQCEKSTTLCNKMIAYSLTVPSFNALYVTCTKPQAKDFSDLKMDPLIDSEAIQKYWVGRRLRYRQNVYFKHFSNHSTIKLRYAMSRKQIYQGLSADMNAIDEMQDIPSDAIALINETLSHSEFKYKIYAGTPKGEDNTLDYWWNLSTQNEFLIKCGHCSTKIKPVWNYIDHANIGKKGLICRECGKRIYPQNGRWFKMNKNSHIEGFRIPQLVVPWKQDEESWRDLLLTIDTYSEAELFNLVLALPYGIGTRPISEWELRRVARIEWQDEPEPGIFHFPIFAGIDWGTNLPGKSDSMLTIMVAIAPDDYRYIYAKRYHGLHWADSTVMVEDMIAICKLFHVNIIASDWGYGGMKNDTLRNEFGWDRVWVVYESGTQKARINWDERAHHYVINRTLSIDDFFTSIKKEQLYFPTWNRFGDFAKDILAEHIELHSKTRKMYYDHSQSKPDDYLHSALMSKIAADKYFQKI